MVTMTDRDDLLELARTLASETGELIIEGRTSAHVAATKSSDIDIVTQVDLAAEAHLRARLARLRPDDGILGEEGDDSPSRSGITWVLDPIDGTVNYLYGLPHFGVSVAAVTGPARPREWSTLAGAVMDGTGTLWSAGAHAGAWRDGVTLRRTSAPPLPQTLLATGFQYIASRRETQGEIVARMIGRVRDIRRLGAAAIDLCHVAAGQVDAYFEHGLRPWDMAAGALIAQEAGVRVAGIDGGAPDERLVIAAMPRVWQELRDTLTDAGADVVWEPAEH